ncbi:hypothetical protein G6F57_012764 [Rhizopus arrhizus]|uniref:Uncharacterized protein n=1 Tax=Rhizopus oryzae TaxID=64495 RepID=A0A9P6X6X8_RHIOR|nr:hypothetical protein G6F23_010858 [Rhizopus arrhizus]KAG1398806.1 hypothetical protein G6F58_011247 [Rhizopus delemar]KAG0761713.1 hypothetical protein G6F24_007352 [Rhizopus arrhizus]KAG0766392.1 hypothetical protein G6F22_017838 [Rhizopus arrhizus]KAG0782295.1 hypothetical protein G6F21_011192 [Rhizopus arrhizus]
MNTKQSHHSTLFSFRKSIDSSLKITPPNSFKQRVSSLLTSPVMTSFKGLRRKSKTLEKEESEGGEDRLEPIPVLPTPPTTPSMMSFEKEVKYDLAYRVHEILGSAVEEVDEEIDDDWEQRRNRLQQSLLYQKTWTITFE